MLKILQKLVLSGDMIGEALVRIIIIKIFLKRMIIFINIFFLKYKIIIFYLIIIKKLKRFLIIDKFCQYLIFIRMIIAI